MDLEHKLKFIRRGYDAHQTKKQTQEEAAA